MISVTRSNASRLAEHWAGIMEERRRRIEVGFMFDGKLYNFDPESKARITGAATLAGMALLTPAAVTGYRWMDPEEDFGWIADDNTVTLMTAAECFAFGKAAAAHERAHIFAARAIKELDPVPADFTDDSYWP